MVQLSEHTVIFRSYKNISTNKLNKQTNYENYYYYIIYYLKET